MSGPARHQPIADIYIRESTDELLRGYSPEQMIADCKIKAAQLGAAVGRVVVEAGKRDEWECPGLLEEIRRAQAGEINYLISWDTARLTGDLGKHLWLKNELKDTAVELHYSTVEFAQTDEGDLHENLLGLFNRYERMKIRARTQNGIKGKLARGQPIGNGPTPYGLERIYDERGRMVGYRLAEAPGALLQIIDGLHTQTAREIAEGLNAAGVATPSGKGRWFPRTVTRIAHNPVYAGFYRYGVTKRTPTRNAAGKRTYREQPHPPSHITSFAVAAVVDATATTRALDGLSQRKYRRRPRRDEQSDPFILRGRLRCAECGGVLSTGDNNGYRRYVCLRARGPKLARTTACRLREVPADTLEAHVLELVADELSDRSKLEALLLRAADPGEAGRRHERQVETVRAELARLEQRIVHAGDVMLDFGKGNRQYDDAKAASLQAEVGLRELEASLRQLETNRPRVMTPAEVDEARRLWDEIANGIDRARHAPSKQRALYRALDVAVVVGPADGDAGVKLGRVNRYTVAWGAEWAVSDSGADSTDTATLLDSQPARRDALRLRLGSLAAAS
jgi:DNA invertase Pin-like site-specific DNA recombinase